MGMCKSGGLGENERVADTMAMYGLLLVRAARKWEIAVEGCSIRYTGLRRMAGSNAVLGGSGLPKRFLVLHYAGARSSQVIPSCTVCRLHWSYVILVPERVLGLQTRTYARWL